MVLSDDTKSELQGWMDNLERATSQVSNDNSDLEVDTDVH